MEGDSRAEWNGARRIQIGDAVNFTVSPTRATQWTDEWIRQYEYEPMNALAVCHPLPYHLPMPSALQRLESQARDVENDLTILIREHSTIRGRFPDSDSGAVVFISARPFGWAPLSQAGHIIQSSILTAYRRHYELIRAIASKLPSDAISTLEEADGLILRAIEQNEPTSIDDKERTLGRARDALRSQLAVLDRLPSVIDAPIVAIPDTNALLANPRLDLWLFPEGIVEIVLVPGVFAELDDLKRRDHLRDRVESIIRQIKEFRRRGKPEDGVVIVNGVSRLRFVAVEPDFSSLPSWLDPNNADDRILASTIEVMRLAIRSHVALVTRDLNLENKAELAGIPYVAPPTIPGDLASSDASHKSQRRTRKVAPAAKHPGGSTTEGGVAPSAKREPPDPVTKLEALWKEAVHIHMRPVVPPNHHADVFVIVEITDSELSLRKQSTSQIVAVPLTSVETVFRTADGHWVISIQGRVQWIDSTERWSFLPESPPADDPFGFSSLGAESHPLLAELKAKGHSLAWKTEHDAKSEAGVTCRIAYGSDGRYLRRLAGRFNQVLVIKPQ